MTCSRGSSSVDPNCLRPRDRRQPYPRPAVVAALQDPAVDLPQLERLIGRDVTLSFRLLRYINSAFFGLRCEVRSLVQALALLGVENIKRWAMLNVLISIENKPPELIAHGPGPRPLLRARRTLLATASPGELFTLGLFSVIDALMDSTMENVLASIPFPQGHITSTDRPSRARRDDCSTASSRWKPETSTSRTPSITTRASSTSNRSHGPMPPTIRCSTNPRPPAKPRFASKTSGWQLVVTLSLLRLAWSGQDLGAAQPRPSCPPWRRFAGRGSASRPRLVDLSGCGRRLTARPGACPHGPNASRHDGHANSSPTKFSLHHRHLGAYHQHLGATSGIQESPP